MTLHFKTLVLVAGTLLALLLVLFISASQILWSGSLRVEEEQARQNVQRVQDALSVSLAQISNTAGDWAGWDETYNFIQNGNRSYYSNFTDAGIGGLSISLMVYIQSSGQIRYSMGYDMKKGIKIPLPQGLREILAAQPHLWQHSHIRSIKSAVLQLPKGPILCVSE